MHTYILQSCNCNCSEYDVQEVNKTNVFFVSAESERERESAMWTTFVRVTRIKEPMKIRGNVIDMAYQIVHSATVKLTISKLKTF